MLYQAYQAQRDLMAPAVAWAGLTARALGQLPPFEADVVLTRPGARCVGLAEAGQLGGASLRANARSMNAREYTPRSRSRAALARHA